MVELTEDNLRVVSFDEYQNEVILMGETGCPAVNEEGSKELKQQILTWQEDSMKLEIAYKAVQSIRDERDTAWNKLEKIKELYEKGIIYVTNPDGTNTKERVGYSHFDHHELQKILNESEDKK